MENIRPKDEVIKDIKEIVKEKGFIYSLCMIILESLVVDPEILNDIDTSNKLSIKEMSLLIGFLIQNKMDFSIPEKNEDLIVIKQKVYELMNELHDSFIITFNNKIIENFNKDNENDKNNFKEFFGSGDMLIEPIFYSGTGLFDFQYLDFLENKYKYDKEWLLKNRNYDIDNEKKFVLQIKNILQNRIQQIHFFNFEEMGDKIKEIKTNTKINKVENISVSLHTILEFYQYEELFIKNLSSNEELNSEELYEKRWNSFYKELIELFIIRKSDFSIDYNFDSFIQNFSHYPQTDFNSNFQGIGYFNWFAAKPIIQLDEERYFVPICFLLFESIYESPYYWMLEDGLYKDKLSNNRGRFGEEISFEFLTKVFGKNQTFKSVKIKTLEKNNSTIKTKDETDIDILSILGSKALCVQVKSKKLTELSRRGNDEQLQKDFKNAVQEAYNQGLISRKSILNKDAKFFDEYGNEILLSEEIDEVYIMGITTENYPSLALQTIVKLDKKYDEPYPIFLTIFDLELIAHYLNDPYDFMYYVRQRTSLMEFFYAEEEIVFLGYHLIEGLKKLPGVDIFNILNDYGQQIDRNFYPLKEKINVKDKGDIIKNKSKNNGFEILCKRIKSFDKPKIVDIIFHLLDLNENDRYHIVKFISKMKNATMMNNKVQDFTMPPIKNSSPRIGLTYISLNSDRIIELKNKLISFCNIRKYKSKGDIWIGLGSLKSSNEIIDIVAFNNQKWNFNNELDKIANDKLVGKEQEQKIKKLGRNDICPCGSQLKYKKCCGRNK